jgi:ABC-2 type transport system ATP-binding protein
MTAHDSPSGAREERPPAELAIAARGVCKAYGAAWGRRARPALAGLTLDVPRGSAFGLIGVNGAGKTTFVKALLGVITTSAGELSVLGGAPRDVSVRARIGYVPERLALPAALGAGAYLHSVARLKGLRGAGHDIAHQLARVGLGSEARERIGRFSKGMRQRLALAAALLGAPDLLILDEPTDGVDPLGRAEIRRVLGEERARGATLLLNSHLLSETERLCDRIAILSGGRIVREGSVRELCRAAGAWLVRFSTRAPSEHALDLAPEGFVALPDGRHRVFAQTPDELDGKLAAARARGALLVELLAESQDLEAVLAEVLEA